MTAAPKKIKLLGICGSPVKDGNAWQMLEEAMRAADGESGVECEIVTLAGREIHDCRQCNWCFKKQSGERRCVTDDDITELYAKMEAAHGIIMATPVYFGRLSGYLATLIDRMRPYVHGNISRGMLRNKVGASMAVSWFRAGGGEMAIATINQFYFAVNMVIASPDLGLTGTMAYSSLAGLGGRDGDDRLLVQKDVFGMASARSTGARVIELARLMHP